MKFIKELVGNLPYFQKRVGEHLEEKKREAQLKKKNLFFIGLGMLLLTISVSSILLFNKNKANDTFLENTTKKYKQKNEISKQQIEKVNSKEINSKTSEQRRNEVIRDFEAWLNSFKNKQVVLEVSKEELSIPISEEIPGKLKQELIGNLISTFNDTVNDGYENILQRTYSSHHISIDSEQGLTIYNQLEEPETWLNTWYLDIEINKKNQKIIMLNDFPFEWIDWREDVRHRETYKMLFNTIDWENDFSYEVIGVDLTHANKNLVSPSIVFILMKYNEELDKWQLTNEIGGIL